jgi:transcriptional regulator with XRE-family HTH domain
MSDMDDPRHGGRNLGAFIKEQRARAQMSLRRLGDVAGVSNVYLSQIEGGLRRPSADVLQRIAKALQISAETLYVQAGILDEERHGSTEAAIMSDPRLSEAQRQAMLTVLRSFLADEVNEPAPESPEAPETGSN